MAETEGATKGPARDSDVAPARDPGRDPAPATGGGPPQPGYVEAMLGLQATAGNRAVVQLLQAGGLLGPVSASGGPAALFAGAWTFGRHPQFPVAMGQTWYNHNDLSWPSFNLTVEQQMLPPWDYEAKPGSSSASKPAWPVLATPENADGYVMSGEDSRYPGKERRIRVGPAAAGKIKAAEQQHVSDLDRGYGVSAGAIDNAINVANAEDPVTGSTAAEAKTNAIDKIVGRVGDLGPKIKPALTSGGRLERVVGPMMDNAFTASKAARDDSGKHTIPVSADPVETTDTAVIFEADGATALDSTSSRTVISIATIGG